MLASDILLSQGIIRRGRACASCQRRKVRCIPATESDDGLPCIRCIKSNRTASCVLASARSARRRHIAQESNTRSAERETEHASIVVSIPPALADISSPTYGSNVAEDNASSNLSEISEASPVPSLFAPSLDRETDAVAEEDSMLQTCQQMSNAGSDTASTMSVDWQHQRVQEVIEYHDGVSSVTILSDVLTKNRPKRLVRIRLKDSYPQGGLLDANESSQLDEEDLGHLQRKGAFTLPPHSICEKFLKLYFDCVYPYTPILNRAEFMKHFHQGTYSPFLMQCMLANVIVYASSELLQEAGFSDSFSAQKIVFARAKLLFDYSVERSQLVLLQGSIMLSSLQFSVGSGYDYRFWHCNAVRLATQMGLHRNGAASDLGQSTRKLLRRIWWVLYCRDVLLAISGLENVRMLDDRNSDTIVLTEDDWDEHQNNVLPEVTKLHKLYLIENCKLSRICSQFLQAFRTPGMIPAVTASRELESALSAWRSNLPQEMRMDSIENWSCSSVWVLVLMVMSYRFECIFYRDLKKRSRLDNRELAIHHEQKQLNAMLHLDTVLEQIMLHDLTGFCPLSVAFCASTVVALHIETAITAPAGSSRKLISRNRIQNGLAYLQIVSSNWVSTKWMLRMFDVVLSRTSLSNTVSTDLPYCDARPIGSPRRDGEPNNTTSNNIANNDGPINDTNIGGFDNEADIDVFGMLVDKDLYDWLPDAAQLDLFAAIG
ncbi:fungal-specific transcription factor domain-containing protein [Xylogone sp. PMI_703]|nr:fungal-specific transcription factor domain-containing protein [Xylogone sp. PMI_703]